MILHHGPSDHKASSQNLVFTFQLSTAKQMDGCIFRKRERLREIMPLLIRPMTPPADRGRMQRGTTIICWSIDDLNRKQKQSAAVAAAFDGKSGRIFFPYVKRFLCARKQDDKLVKSSRLLALKHSPLCLSFVKDLGKIQSKLVTNAFWEPTD